MKRTVNRRRGLHVFLFYRAPVVFLHLDTMIAGLMEYSFAVSFYSLSEVNAYSRSIGVNLKADRLAILIQNGMHVKKQKLQYLVCSRYPQEYLEILITARTYPLQFLEELAWTTSVKLLVDTLSMILRAIHTIHTIHTQRTTVDRLDILNNLITNNPQSFVPTGENVVRSLAGDPCLGYSLIIAVKSGCRDIVEFIIKEGRCDPNVKSGLALYIALDTANVRIMETLLQCGATITQNVLAVAHSMRDRRFFDRLNEVHFKGIFRLGHKLNTRRPRVNGYTENKARQ